MKRQTWIYRLTAVLLLVIPVVLLIWGFLLPPQYEETFLGELQEKVELLEAESEKPRIILVGGSGVAFGADSALIEQQLPGYRVVNFGMYAALGTTVMMDLSQNAIREGDIVLLIPEQQAQTLSTFFDPHVFWQGLDGAFSLLGRLPGDKLLQLAGAFPQFAGEKFSWILRGETPSPEGVYRRDAFNAYGDVESPLADCNRMPGGYDPDTPILFDAALPEDGFVERVRAYAKVIEQAGGSLWYGCCPMNAAAAQDLSTLDDFYTALQARLGIPLAGDPRDFLLDAGWFFDTNFHPNQAGRTVYTTALIRSIKAMLGDSSPTVIPEPAMPAPAEAELWHGEDSDADCFLYDERDGALTLIGLTEAGMQRTSLVVPSTVDGKPIQAIANGAFQGAEQLETITIQQNIRRIGDSAFGGCSSLRRIVIEQETPSACRVGQDLLAGTDALVYVPADALSAYRTDYFWSLYGTLIQPMEP